MKQLSLHWAEVLHNENGSRYEDYVQVISRVENVRIVDYFIRNNIISMLIKKNISDLICKGTWIKS
jgi:hypothetical protein